METTTKTKDEQRKRSASRLTLRGTPREREEWEAAAARLGISVTEWLRTVANRAAEREAQLAGLRGAA